MKLPHEADRAIFPRLTADDYRITSPATWDYNCIAWTAGVVTGWWWPVPYDCDWPTAIPREETLDAFLMAFATLGYAPCVGAELEPGVEKIALYAREGTPTHAARQLPNGVWSSKLGPNVDIEHATLETIGGGVYGEPVAVLGRPRSSADKH
jgi:hypothetical protein